MATFAEIRGRVERLLWLRMELRPELARVVQVLLARPERHLTLDVIGDAIGTLSVTFEDIDAIFRALEGEQRSVGEADARSASNELALTLASARRLRRALGRAPTAQEIAADAQISLAQVRSALLFARILQR